MTVRFELESSDRDALLLALAWLSLDRPGWTDYLRGIAGALCGKVDDVGGESFDEFRRLNEDRLAPGPRDVERMHVFRRRDCWIFVDQHGDQWRLVPTGEPSFPFTVQLVGRV